MVEQPVRTSEKKKKKTGSHVQEKMEIEAMIQNL
jgi:hypothetical protein